MLNLFFILVYFDLIKNSFEQGSDVSFPAPKFVPKLVNNYKGPNLSGAEFNSGPNRTINHDYTYPNSNEIDYYAEKGFGMIRLPFDIARAYDHVYSSLNMTQIGYIKIIVDYCLSKGMRVLLDPHNYGFIYDNRTEAKREIGTDVEGTNLFADFWYRMAIVFKNYSNVLFGLMNEPHKQNATQWYTGAVPAIKAIRTAGATQTILIPGTYYTGAHAWIGSGNAAAWAGFKGDPLNNFVFEMHQYLDSDSSGTHRGCKANASHALLGATEWLIQNKYKAILAEFGWTTDLSCANESVPFMDYLSANSDAWLGWTWWCGGPWYPWTYMFQLDPIDFIEPIIDKPQLATLLAHL